MNHWAQTRPTLPGRYEVKPCLEAQERIAELVKKPSGLYMTRIGDRETFLSVASLSATLWWRGPLGERKEQAGSGTGRDR